MPQAIESKKKRMARKEVERLTGVVARRKAKHDDGKRKLRAAKDLLKAAK